MLARVLTLGVSCLLLAASSAPASAQATPAPSRDGVRQILSAYEGGPTAAEWRAMGPQTLAVLVSLYDDSSQPAYVRLRVLSAVASFPTPATRTFLLAATRAPGQSDLFVREAVLSLGRAFGAGALDDVTPFLGSRETVVREAAARSLALIGTPAAREALRRRLVLEPDATVRATLETALRR